MPLVYVTYYGFLIREYLVPVLFYSYLAKPIIVTVSFLTSYSLFPFLSLLRV